MFIDFLFLLAGLDFKLQKDPESQSYGIKGGTTVVVPATVVLLLYVVQMNDDCYTTTTTWTIQPPSIASFVP